MKVVVNARFLTQKITGVQRYAIEISRELKKLLNNEVKFIAPSNIIHQELAEYLEVEVVGNNTGLLWEQIDLNIYLSRNKKPLLLNLCNTAPLFYKKNILVSHDLIFIKNKKWFSKKFSGVFKFCMPFLLNNSLKIITVSDFSKQDIIKTFNTSPEKIEVVYNAVSNEFMKFSNENFENSYGDYILTVASLLSPRKNLCGLIDAFERMNESELKLVIVGEKVKNFSDKKALDKIKLNENIVLTGFVKDKELLGLYKNAKLFVFPSLYEGFGIPPLEAMACGCPVLVSAVTSLPEVCADAAYYVNPSNTDEITKGMERILSDDVLRKDLIQKGYKRQADFSWEESAAKIAEIIKSFAFDR